MSMFKRNWCCCLCPICMCRVSSFVTAFARRRDYHLSFGVTAVTTILRGRLVSQAWVGLHKLPHFPLESAFQSEPHSNSQWQVGAVCETVDGHVLPIQDRAFHQRPGKATENAGVSWSHNLGQSNQSSCMHLRHQVCRHCTGQQ